MIPIQKKINRGVGTYKMKSNEKEQKIYTVEMTEKEYREYMKSQEDYIAKKREKEEKLKRARVFKELVYRRILEYPSKVKSKDTIYNAVRCLIGLRCNIPNTCSQGLTETQFRSMCNMLDLVLPAQEELF